MDSPVACAPGFARRAESLHLAGDSDAALRLLTTGVELHPEDVTARLVLARVCRDCGRLDEARDWLESVLRSDPECPAALLQLARSLELPAGAGGRDPRREQALARLRAQEPWHAWTDESQVVAAVPSSPRSIEPEAPEIPMPIARPAAIPEPRASRSEPVQSFAFPVREEEEEPEIEENSAPHVATVTLAEIYLQQGLKEQAAQIYRQLLERQPGDDSVRRRLQEIEKIEEI